MQATATTPKGRARRAALVEAAAGLLTEGGPGAVSARAVAARAGVPLAATTYYFAGTGALVHEAACAVAERHLATARAAVDAAGPGTDAASLLLDVVTGGVADPNRVAAHYERALVACRTPVLAAALAGFDAQLDAVVAGALHACGRASDRSRAVMALVDGALVGALLAAATDPKAAAREVVASALDAVAPPERVDRRSE